MRAGLRWTIILLGGGLLAAAAPALGQSVPEATSNTPATNSIGPSELQNFSLPGTSGKPADAPAQVAPVANAPAHDKASVTSDAKPTSVPARREPTRPAARGPVKPRPVPSTSALQPAATNAFSGPSSNVAGEVPPPPAALPVPAPVTGSQSMPAPERRPSILPWLAAALALVAGTIFIFWRRNQQQQQQAFADGPDLLARTEPLPAPQPLPAPVPATLARRAPGPSEATEPMARAAQVSAGVAAPRGIVASRLRPAIELGVQPLRCLVDQEQVTIEFEVELFNSGTAPARAVIAEASLFNASATQDDELAAFYAKPPAQGDRIDSIAPMRRMTFTNRVVAPRAAVHEYELGGRKSFVPVLAFNAQYEWSGGKGQSSLAFLLGRETSGDKLGPLHLDSTPREVRGLGARVLPSAVRT